MMAVAGRKQGLGKMWGARGFGGVGGLLMFKVRLCNLTYRWTGRGAATVRLWRKHSTGRYLSLTFDAPDI